MNWTSGPSTLPYAWDVLHAGERGEAEFDLRFDLAQLPTEPWGLFIPKLGNAYQVRINGRLLERRGDLVVYNGADYSLAPRYLDVPPEMLMRVNYIQVRIRADLGRRGGLSHIVVGPAEEVYPLYRRELHLGSTGLLLVVAFSGVVGFLSLALWATQPRLGPQADTRRDSLYLYAGLAELCWTLRVGFSHIEQPPLAWPWWGVVPVTSLGIWCCFMAFFCMELTGWRSSWPVLTFRRSLVVLMVTGPVIASLALAGGYPLVLTVWYALLGLGFVAFASWFVVHALRSPSIAQRAVAAAVLINVTMGLRDLYVFRIQPSYPGHSMLYYASALFGLTLGVVVITRFRSAAIQARELMHTLSSRIAMRENELNGSYQRLEALAREQERAAERSRILQDMHDGVGSHISAAIRQLQSGRARDEDVLQTLRASLDQLKLTVDAMHLPDGDITALLANLRYRLEPRFQASDIELQWGVELLAPMPRLDAHAMRHLQFMVFEALSNVLQHSGASSLRIEASMTDVGACLRIVDNGTGFDAQCAPRKGLRAMRERARALDAELHIDSRVDRTAVEIHIPTCASVK